MLLLLVSIITNEKIDQKCLIKDTKKCIIYHFLCNARFLKNISEEEVNIFKTDDHIEYKAGGTFIDALCNTIIYKEPTKIFNKISKTKFTALLNKNIESCIHGKAREYIDGGNEVSPRCGRRERYARDKGIKAKMHPEINEEN